MTAPTVSPNGTRFWPTDWNPHRLGGPAVEMADGSKYWFRHGLLYRDGDLPAVEEANGYRAWCLHGEWHRKGGPARVFRDGTKYWYRRGKLHRDRGPAVEEPGYRAWFRRGKFVKGKFVKDTEPMVRRRRGP